MKTHDKSKFPHFVIGMGLGAVAALPLVPRRWGKETRKVLRERSNEILDYLRQQTAKLRDTAEEIGKKGQGLIGCRDSVTKKKNESTWVDND